MNFLGLHDCKAFLVRQAHGQRLGLCPRRLKMDYKDSMMDSTESRSPTTSSKVGFPLPDDEDEEFSFQLPPVPSLGKFKEDKWANHPLLGYYGHLLKREVDDSVIVRRARKTKTKICDKIVKEKRAKAAEADEDKPNLETFLNQEDYVEFLRDSVRSAPVNSLHKKWRKKILGVRMRALFPIIQ